VNVFEHLVFTMMEGSSVGSVRFSSSVLSADLEDVLGPSQTCILPAGGGMGSSWSLSSGVPGKGAPAGSVLAPMVPTPSPSAENAGTVTAKVTLSDCLVCSGCVTTAETVLLQTHSVDQARDALLTASMVVVSLSRQSVASLAAAWRISMDRAARRIACMLRDRCGVHAVVTVDQARQLALDETFREFSRCIKNENDSVSEPRRPVLCTSCPGFVLLAEKSESDPTLLSHLSRVKSPQAIVGTLVKRVLPGSMLWRKSFESLEPLRHVHIAVMPCYDKKLEAARGELRCGEPAVAETDIVLTSSELLEFLRSYIPNPELFTDESPLDDLWRGPGALSSPFERELPLPGSPSGGYAAYLLDRLYQECIQQGRIVFRTPFESVRGNVDLLEASIRDGDGNPLYTFATAYGFRNVRNIMRKVKGGNCSYDYIEIMSCPGGCTNGGGQLLSREGAGIGAARKQLNEINELYSSSSIVSPKPSSQGSLTAIPSNEADGEGHQNSMYQTSFRVLPKRSVATSMSW